jgi:hypothetical protein
LASTTRPICAIARPRTGAGTSAQAGCASRAARAAAANVPASPSETSATTSLIRAGLVDVIRPPGAPVTGTPPTIEVMLRLIVTSLRSDEQNVDRHAYNC